MQNKTSVQSEWLHSLGNGLKDARTVILQVTEVCWRSKSLFMQSCFEKQMRRCFCLGAGIVVGLWCFSRSSDCMKDIGWNWPMQCPRQKKKKKKQSLQSHKRAREHEKKKPVEYSQHILWSDKTDVNLCGSAETCPRLPQCLHGAGLRHESGQRGLWDAWV